MGHTEFNVASPYRVVVARPEAVEHAMRHLEPHAAGVSTHGGLVHAHDRAVRVDRFTERGQP
jgi:hypothetical protein